MTCHIHTLSTQTGDTVQLTLAGNVVSRARELLKLAVEQHPNSGINTMGVDHQANPQISSTQDTCACTSFQVIS